MWGLGREVWGVGCLVLGDGCCFAAILCFECFFFSLAGIVQCEIWHAKFGSFRSAVWLCEVWHARSFFPGWSLFLRAGVSLCCLELSTSFELQAHTYIELHTCQESWTCAKLHWTVCWCLLCCVISLCLFCAVDCLLFGVERVRRRENLCGCVRDVWSVRSCEEVWEGVRLCEKGFWGEGRCLQVWQGTAYEQGLNLEMLWFVQLLASFYIRSLMRLTNRTGFRTVETFHFFNLYALPVQRDMNSTGYRQQWGGW